MSKQWRHCGCPKFNRGQIVPWTHEGTMLLTTPAVLDSGILCPVAHATIAHFFNAVKKHMSLQNDTCGFD